MLVTLRVYLRRYRVKRANQPASTSVLVEAEPHSNLLLTESLVVSCISAGD